MRKVQIDLASALVLPSFSHLPSCICIPFPQIGCQAPLWLANTHILLKCEYGACNPRKVTPGLVCRVPIPPPLARFRHGQIVAKSAAPTHVHPSHAAYIKLLGPSHSYPEPTPTGQAPVVYAARCLFTAFFSLFGREAHDLLFSRHSLAAPCR